MRRPDAPISILPGSVTCVVLTLFSIVALLPFCERRQEQPAPLPRNVETLISAIGEDSRHRSLPFTIYVLSQELSWKLESTSDLEGGARILSPELIDTINRAADVFCVGTASHEGGRRAEEARAARRADQLTGWVASVIRDAPRTHLYTLNAGQYKGETTGDSSCQRKAILIATSTHDPRVNLAEALASGLERQQRQYPFVYALLHSYSRSDRWLDPSLLALR